MTLLSAWPLTGLVLLVPLVIAHLRREQSEIYDVPSLLLWDGLEQQTAPSSRWPRLPRLPLLLLLQALALVLLVVALARPSATRSPPAATRVYVLDDSLWMGAGGRLGAAETRIEKLAGRMPRGAPVLIVLADAFPHVIYRGPATRLSTALARVATSLAPATLTQAMSLVAGLLSSSHDRVILLHAPEDRVPAVRSLADELQTVVVGTPLTDQGIFSPSARCGIAGPGGCEVVAAVTNRADKPAADRYAVYADDRAAGTGIVRVAAGATANVVLPARPGEQIRVQLAVRDAIPADDQAWITVPGPSGAPPSTTVMLVGEPSDALPVARALAAVPGVKLRLRTPQSYRPADARVADLTVADGWLPGSGLPPSPAVVLINPPRLPGGRVGPPLSDSAPSGMDARSDLVSGIDLSSLAISAGGARALTLPGYLVAVVWSPDGPLLAAGDNGSQRVALLSFDPALSDLPQLTSFPILASNLLRWGAGWMPSSAPAGEPLQIDATPGTREIALGLDGAVVARTALGGEGAAQVPVARPGLYTVTETGPRVTRRATVAVSVAAPTAVGFAVPQTAPVDLTVTRAAAAPKAGPLLAPWLLGAAIVALVLEWAYWRSRTRRVRAVAG